MFIGCAMLFALMLVVVGDVSLRYLFNAPLQWSYEVISSYLMPGLFFMAVSHTLKANAHVAVDILHNYVGRTTRYVFEAVSTVVALPVFALCTGSRRSTPGTTAKRRHLDERARGPTWTITMLPWLRHALAAPAPQRLRLHRHPRSGREVRTLPPISGRGAHDMRPSLTILLFVLLTLACRAFLAGVAGSVGCTSRRPRRAGRVITTAPRRRRLVRADLDPDVHPDGEFVILSGVADDLSRRRRPGSAACPAPRHGDRHRRCGFGAISGSEHRIGRDAVLDDDAGDAEGRLRPEAGGRRRRDFRDSCDADHRASRSSLRNHRRRQHQPAPLGGVIPASCVRDDHGTVWALVAIDPSSAPPAQATQMGEKIRSLKVVGPMLLLFMGRHGVIYPVSPRRPKLPARRVRRLPAAWREGTIHRAILGKALVHAAHASCMSS